MLTSEIKSADTQDGINTSHGDYGRVARALEYVVEHFETQPSLEDIAAHAGVSPHHFQRLFTRWVGLSPKKFMQTLSLEQAKARLTENESVLEAAFDAGLSGPGRLHDLFVTHEALTPGDYKAMGRDLIIRYGFHEGPFGTTILFVSPRGLCGLAFVDARGQEACFQDMADRFALSTLVQDQDATAALMGQIFHMPGAAGETDHPPLRLVLKGTAFQIKVWQALMAIPPGGLTTYGTVANAMGMGGAASRAVGTAVGANPISWLIPCHRVIRNSGMLGGYRWGLPRKLAMMGWEENGLPAPNGGQLQNVA